jgi:hypothetical protein
MKELHIPAWYISESHLTKDIYITDPEISISGYNIFRRDRQNNNNGGTVMLSNVRTVPLFGRNIFIAKFFYDEEQKNKNQYVQMIARYVLNLALYFRRFCCCFVQT